MYSLSIVIHLKIKRGGGVWGVGESHITSAKCIVNNSNTKQKRKYVLTTS
jgi:hypothetical protein